MGLFWRGSQSKYPLGLTLEGLLESDSLEGILERVAVRGGSSGRLTQPLAAYLTP